MANIYWEISVEENSIVYGRLTDGTITYPETSIQVESPVAQRTVNDKIVCYQSLESAIKASGTEETTIIILKDTEENAIIEEGKNIIIDLNSKTITSTSEITIINNGTIVIEEKGGVCIYNEGDLVIIGDETKSKILVSNENAIGIYNSDEAKTCNIGFVEILVQEKVEEVENEVLENTEELTLEENKELKESYAIYNNSNVIVNIESIIIKIDIPNGIGICNKLDGSIVLGKTDDIMDEKLVIIKAISKDAVAIVNSEKGQIKFYDGIISSLNTIKENITEIADKHEIIEVKQDDFINTILKEI